MSFVSLYVLRCFYVTHVSSNVDQWKILIWMRTGADMVASCRVDSGTGPSGGEERAPITLVYEPDDAEAGTLHANGDAEQADDMLTGAGSRDGYEAAEVGSGMPAEAEEFSDEWGRPVDAEGNLLTEDGQLWLDETGSPVYAYDAPLPDGDLIEGRTQ